MVETNVFAQIMPNASIKVEVGQDVFVCGDVHGHRDEFFRRLAQVGCEIGQDVLIFTGDLIDRGPHSAEMLHFLDATPYVFSVIGNHEVSFLNSLKNPKQRLQHLSANYGGYWIEDHTGAELERFGELIISSMPATLTVETPDGTVGIVHACAPDNWQMVGSPSASDMRNWIESREQFQRAALGMVHVVEGVDTVIHGHVCSHKTISGNHIWIDTFFHTGRLTIQTVDSLLREVKAKRA